jgi:hypothetical protein
MSAPKLPLEIRAFSAQFEMGSALWNGDADSVDLVFGRAGPSLSGVVRAPESGMVVVAAMVVPNGTTGFELAHSWSVLKSESIVGSEGTFNFPSLCPGRWLVTLKAGARSVASKEIDVDGSAAAVEF